MQKKKYSIIGIGLCGSQIIEGLDNRIKEQVYTTLIIESQDTRIDQNSIADENIVIETNFLKDQVNYIYNLMQSNDYTFFLFVGNLSEKFTFQVIQNYTSNNFFNDSLTIGLFSMPYTFEGSRIAQNAFNRLQIINGLLDTTIPYFESKFKNKFLNIDESFSIRVEHGVLLCSELLNALIHIPNGRVRIFFPDFNLIFQSGKLCSFSTGTAEGASRSRLATSHAISKLFNNFKSQKSIGEVLLNITANEEEITMTEILEITKSIENSHFGSNLIWTLTDEKENKGLRVSLFLTNLEMN